MEINFVIDVALKCTKVTPGMQIIERLYGMLEIHSESQADVRQAGAAILEALDLKEEGRYKPVIYSNNIIRRIDDYHTMLINRTRHGNMILPGIRSSPWKLPRPPTPRSPRTKQKKPRTSTSSKSARSADFGRLYLGGADFRPEDGQQRELRFQQHVPVATRFCGDATHGQQWSEIKPPGSPGA